MWWLWLACSTPPAVPEAPDARVVRLDGSDNLVLDGEVLAPLPDGYVDARLLPEVNEGTLPLAVLLPADTPMRRVRSLLRGDVWWAVEGAEGPPLRFGSPSWSPPTRRRLTPTLSVEVEPHRMRAFVTGWYDPSEEADRPDFLALAPVESAPWQRWRDPPSGPRSCAEMFEDADEVRWCEASDGAPPPWRDLELGSATGCFIDEPASADWEQAWLSTLASFDLGEHTLVAVNIHDEVPWVGAHGLLRAVDAAGMPWSFGTMGRPLEGLDGACRHVIHDATSLRRATAEWWGAWIRLHTPVARVDVPKLELPEEAWVVHVQDGGLYVHGERWADWPPERGALEGVTRAARRREPGCVGPMTRSLCHAALLLPADTPMATAARVDRAVGGASWIGVLGEEPIPVHDRAGIEGTWGRPRGPFAGVVPEVALALSTTPRAGAIQGRVVGFEPSFRGESGPMRGPTRASYTALPWDREVWSFRKEGACELAFGEVPELLALCRETTAPDRSSTLSIGGRDGCLSGPGATPSQRRAWRTTLRERLEELGVEPPARVMAQVDGDFPWDGWVAVAAALHDGGHKAPERFFPRKDDADDPLAGLPLPGVDASEDRFAPDPPCTAAVRTAQGLREAAARSVGASQRE